MMKQKLMCVLGSGLIVLSSFLGVLQLFPNVVNAESNKISEAQEMYRLYNPNSGEHFYTNNLEEKNNLVDVGWCYEGIGWYAPEKGDAVYRLYNKNAGDHHYTLNENEKNNLVKVGWKFEGIGWYSSEEKKIPLYRSYNPNATAGSHNYTSNKNEHTNLINAGWQDEGIAWYGAEKKSDTTESTNSTSSETTGTSDTSTKSSSTTTENSVTTPTSSASEKPTTTETSSTSEKPATTETSSTSEKPASTETSSTSEKPATTETSSTTEETSTTTEEPGGSDKEKVVLAGYASVGNGDILKETTLKLEKDGKIVEEIKTNEDGYFFVHVTLDDTYTINGKDFQVTVIAHKENDFTITNQQGSLSLGKKIVSEKGEATLKGSVITLEEESVVSEDGTQVSILEDIDVLTNDIFVTAPTPQNPSGVAYRVTSVTKIDGQTILTVVEPTLEEVIQDLSGEDNVSLANAIFIPEGDVEVVPPSQGNLRSLAPRIGGSVSGKWTLKKSYKNDNLEVNGAFSVEGEFDVSADAGYRWDSGFQTKFDVSSTLTQTITSDITIKGSYNSGKDIRLGEFIVPTHIPGINIEIPVYLLVSVDGKATLSFEASTIAKAGVRKEFNSNDISVYPGSNEMISIPTPTYKFNGEFDSKLGLDTAVQVSAIGLDIVEVNGKVGLGYGCTAKVTGEGTEVTAATFKQKVYAFATLGAGVPFMNWNLTIFPMKEWVLYEKEIDKASSEGNEVPEVPENPEKPLNPSEPTEPSTEENWIPITEENFPDPYFRSYLKGYQSYVRGKYDEKSKLLYHEINTNAIKSVSISSGSLVSDVTGVRLFKNLTSFSVHNNVNIQSVDLSGLQYLSNVSLSKNNIRNLKLAGLSSLKEFSCKETEIQTLDISDSKEMTRFTLNGTRVKELNISNCPFLISVNCDNNMLEKINTTGSKNIQALSLADNQFKEIDITGLPNLSDFSIKNNFLTQLNITGHKKIYLYVNLRGNPIVDIYAYDYLINEVPKAFNFSYTGVLNIHMRDGVKKMSFQ